MGKLSVIIMGGVILLEDVEQFCLMSTYNVGVVLSKNTLIWLGIEKIGLVLLLFHEFTYTQTPNEY
jgi:hypothetical protein